MRIWNGECAFKNKTITGPSPNNNPLNAFDIKHFTLHIMSYPLYDVPYLVREPNDSYMSMMRHKIEVENQAIVDDYFIERDKGTSAGWAQKLVARKHGIPIMRVEYCLRWYYQEAVRRGKYGFLQKFPPEKEHIVQFRLIFALA